MAGPYVFQQFIPTIKRKSSAQNNVVQAIDSGRRISGCNQRSSTTTTTAALSNTQSRSPGYQRLSNTSTTKYHQPQRNDDMRNSSRPVLPKITSDPRRVLADPGGQQSGSFVSHEYVGLRYSSNYRNVPQESSAQGHYLTKNHKESSFFNTIVSMADVPPTQKNKSPVLRKRQSQIDFITTDGSDMQQMMRLLSIQAQEEIHNDVQQNLILHACDDDNDLDLMDHEMPDEEEELPSLTPEPDWMKEYGKNLDQASPDKHGYRPKNCWCNRCQMMYRMHKTGDEALKNWGNYPCFQW